MKGGKSLISLVFFLLSLSPICAQEENKDSLNEVVVTGIRQETDVRHLSMNVSVIDRKDIELEHSASVLPLLSEHVPGLFVTSRGMMGYGVSGGSAGNISLRGLSSSGGQMMVLVDGHPQFMGLFGHPTPDAYQSLMVERIEVLRGPASMLYGGNAMGGVINIVTRKMREDGVSTSANVGYGSYNTLETELVNRWRKGKFTSIAGVSYNRTDGHRPEMKFEQVNGFVKLGYKISQHWNMTADASITYFNAQQPGMVTEPLNDARQTVNRILSSVAVENKYEKTTGSLSLFYNWGRHKINDGYKPMSGEMPLDYLFYSLDDMMGASWNQNLRLFKGNLLTVGFDWFRFGGDAWNQYVAGSQKGQKKDIADKTENEVAAYLDIRQHIGTRLTLNAGFRIDHHSRVGTEYIPQVGVAMHLPHSLELKASAVKGFRNPSIKEMYMFPVQNPNLKSERLWSYELTLSQCFFNRRLKYGINVYYINGDNMILTLPNPKGAGRLNQNSGTIENVGVEADVNYHIRKEWQINANYSWLNMKNPVVAAPEHKLYVGTSYSKSRWNVATGVQYVEGLYTSTLPNKKENFVLWNLRCNFNATKWLDVWAKGENLLAQRYEINAGYPMPKATVMVGLSLKL